MLRILSILILLVIALAPLPVNAQEGPPTEEYNPIPIGTQIPYQKGISVVLYGNDTTMQGNTVAFFDDLDSRELGVNSIIFTFPIFQDGATTTVLYEDPLLTPSEENIRIFLREGRSRGYYVWLKPLIDDERTGTWRGAIVPGGDFNDAALDEWFANYGALILKYAAIAEEERALGLIIGAEMESLDKDQQRYTDRWNQLIASVRAVYSGNVTYAKNWTPVSELPGFAPSLDVLMVDAFFDLHGIGNDATSTDIYYAWQEWLPYLRSYHDRLNMPIMFAEVGVTPRVGSFITPWNGNNGGRRDFSAQTRYYAGTCQFMQEFGESFGFNGPFWWAVGFYDRMENQRDRAINQGVLTYNFYDLPSEAEIRSCFNQ